MKICGLLISVFLYLCQCQASTWICEYEDEHFSFEDEVTTTTFFGYTCNLRPYSIISSDMTQIVGQHQIRKTDNSVRCLSVNGNLKKLRSIICGKFKNLENIWLESLNIELIEVNFLQNCGNLKVIYWEGITLMTLPWNFLINQNKLEELHLWNNQINFLPSEIFNSLVNLRILNLRENMLQVLDPKWFVSLKNLKFLILKYNQISEVPGGVFRSLKGLEKIWLGCNKITTLRSDSFEGMQSLKGLFLNENEISELPRGVFVPLSNLISLSLRYNKLKVIHSDSFGSHSRLTLIKLQYNKISAFDKNIIDITAVKNLGMKNNLCYNIDITTRIKMKTKLQNCINNYQTRPGNQIISSATAYVTSTSISKFYAVTQPTIPIRSDMSACGSSIIAKGNIIGGAQTTRGSFPWNAALVKTDEQFFCGGTLVSNRKVVTAAHCIQFKNKHEIRLARDFFVLLGVHNLTVRNEAGRITYAIHNIHMHPDWNPFAERYDADIAVLVVEGEVTFGRFIQPICLIDTNSAIKDISSGVVIGFGQSEDETKKNENIAKILDMPIHSIYDCIENNYKLGIYLGRRSFCAGSGTGVGVCDGDSGSGLYVKYNDVYYLRGVVSASLNVRNYTHGCDVNNYAIFTDVPKFTDWINGINVNEIDEIFGFA